MDRVFNIADKVVNGQKLTNYNSVTGQAEIVKWDVAPEDVPNLADSSYVIFKAAEDVVIPSLWKGFGSQVTNSFNQFTDKINSFLSNIGSNSPYQPPVQQMDADGPFKPVEIHTGVNVTIPNNEALFIHSYAGGLNGITLAAGVQLVIGSTTEEIKIFVYNFFPHDVVIKKGQPIAIGIFQEIKCGDATVQSQPFTVDPAKVATENVSQSNGFAANQTGFENAQNGFAANPTGFEPAYAPTSVDQELPGNIQTGGEKTPNVIKLNKE